MIGRQLVTALARRQEAIRAPVSPLPVLELGCQQPGLRRPCGCDIDVTVFGHVCCQGAPPWMGEAR